jgi:hypothetical protein
MAVNDLAGGFTYAGNTPEQLLAGDEPIKTASAVAGANLTKYQIAAHTAAGVVAFVVGTHTAAQSVLVMQPVSSGQMAQFAYAGKFNDTLLATYNTSLYANAAFDTFAERQAFWNGLFRVGRVGQGFDA